MKTIAVANGDIQLNNGKIQFVTGSQKLIQDLQRWLEEPLGTGFTTPGFGSMLSQYVGSAQSSGLSTSLIENEIARILQLYQGNQAILLKQAQNSAQIANWNKSEVIQQILSINTTVQGTTVTSSVAIQTVNNSTINLNIAINTNGVSVTNG